MTNSNPPKATTNEDAELMAVRGVISQALHHAYYNGLDKKGYSLYEEAGGTKSIEAVPTHLIETELKELRNE